MDPQGGLEPPTPWFEARRSDPLSYWGLVPPAGFEPATPGLRDRSSNPLSYDGLLSTDEC